MSDPGQTPPQGSPSPTPEDVRANKAVAAIAYLLFFCAAARREPFTLCDVSRQSRPYAAARLDRLQHLTGTYSSAQFAARAFSPPLCLVFCVIGMMNAINGDMKPLPLIGRIEIIKHP